MGWSFPGIGKFVSRVIKHGKTAAAALVKNATTAVGSVLTAAKVATRTLDTSLGSWQSIATKGQSLGVGLQFALSLSGKAASVMNILTNPLGAIKGMVGVVAGKAINDITSKLLNPVLSKAGFNINIGINPGIGGPSLGLSLAGPAGLGLTVGLGSSGSASANLSIVNGAIQAKISTSGATMKTQFGTQAIAATGTAISFHSGMLSLGGSPISSSTSVSHADQPGAAGIGKIGGRQGGITVGTKGTATGNQNPVLPVETCPPNILDEGLCELTPTGYEDYTDPSGATIVPADDQLSPGSKESSTIPANVDVNNYDDCDFENSHNSGTSTSGYSSPASPHGDGIHGVE